MTLVGIGEALPAFANDLRVNLEAVLERSSLDGGVPGGTVLGAAIASCHRSTLHAPELKAKRHLGPGSVAAAKAAAL